LRQSSIINFCLPQTMYLLLSLFSLITPGTDIRTFPEECMHNHAYQWRVACSMSKMDEGLAAIENTAQTSGLNTVMQEAELGTFNVKNSEDVLLFSPWITQKPDTTIYGGVTVMTEWDSEYPSFGVNVGFLSEQRPLIETSLQSGIDRPCTQIKVGEVNQYYNVTACSANIPGGDTHYATFMTWSQTMGNVLCDGDSDSSCNVWVGANLLGKIQYDMKSQTAEEVKARFNGGVYNHGAISSSLINSLNQVWSVSNQTMPWFSPEEISNYGEISSFEMGSQSYKGWKIPMTMDGATYQIAITYMDVAEPTFPVSTWADLDESKSSCDPLLQTDDCDAYAIASYILGSVLQADANSTTAELAAMFEADTFNFGDWVPEMRKTADGTLYKRGTSGTVDDVTFTEEAWWVVAETLNTAGQYIIDHQVDQGSLRTYVVPLSDGDYFAQLSFVNEKVTTTTETAAPTSAVTETTKSSSGTLYAFVALFAAWAFW